jgi:hypothetical protein
MRLSADFSRLFRHGNMLAIEELAAAHSGLSRFEPNGIPNSSRIDLIFMTLIPCPVIV